MMKIKKDPFLKPIQFKSKHKFLKGLLLVSFFVGISQMRIPTNPDLPYDDSQNTETDPNDTNNEMELGLQAYNHLLDILYEKCQNMGVNLQEGYLVRVVAYDIMTNNIDVIMQKDSQSLYMKFSDINLNGQSINLTGENMADQISKLINILDAPVLETPVITTLSSQLKTSLQTIAGGVQNYARTNVQLSDGNIRSENDSYGLVAGRDYNFFNVYGKGTKEGVKYNTVLTIAMNVDDMEVYEIDDLINFYISNSNDQKIVVNLSYQENLNTLEVLNEQKTNFGLEY